MKVFKCKDGNNRVFSKREKGFDAETMATLVLSAHTHGCGEDSVADAIKACKNKSAILDIVWDEIFTNGMEVPHYRVGDMHSDPDAAINAVEEKIKKVFKDL